MILVQSQSLPFVMSITSIAKGEELRYSFADGAFSSDGSSLSDTEFAQDELVTSNIARFTAFMQAVRA